MAAFWTNTTGRCDKPHISRRLPMENAWSGSESGSESESNTKGPIVNGYGYGYVNEYGNGYEVVNG
jgi:hypothetical protein